MKCETILKVYKALIRTYRYDSLTGFKMRKDFEAETAQRLQTESFTLIMYDVIDLHRINREQGYKAGDAKIKEVAENIRATEPRDVYRIGGDEFVAIYPGILDKVPEVEGCTVGMAASTAASTVDDLLTIADKEIIEKKKSLNRRKDDRR